MKIKDTLAEFDKTLQEEASKNVAENTEPVEQPGEAKSEGEFVEAPKAEDVPDNETDQEEQLEADAEELEAKADDAEEDAEDKKEDAEDVKEDEAEKAEDDKDEVADEEEVAEEAKEAKEEDEEADEDGDEEEKAEKSVDEDEDVEKANVTSKEDQKKKEKQTDADVKDSLKDKEDESEEKDKEPNKKKKKKEEKVEKSEDEISDLENLVGLVFKSYQQTVESQNAMLNTIDDLKAQVEALNSKLEQKTEVVEEASKSILSDETKVEEEVEDKAVSYASKNMTPEAEVAEEVDHNEDEAVQVEEAKETFSYGKHKEKFMQKFQHDLEQGNMARRDVNLYRQAFIDASEGVASENALNLLYGYVKD